MQTDKIIVFDLFGVVFTKGLDSSIDHLTAVLNRPSEKVSKVYRKWEYQFDLGEIDEFEFWSRVNTELKTNVRHRILNNLVLSSYRLKNETVLLINYLKKISTIVVYSNYRREWFEALDSKYRISNLFDKVYLSSDTKILKPDFKAFEIIKNDYSTSCENMILIDDEERNIEGIRTWGGNGILFKNIYETEIEVRNIFKVQFPKYDDYYSGILLVTKSGALILQRRDNRAGIANPGKLSVFGGRRKKNESAEDCAVRELREETGIVIESPDLISPFEDVCNFAYPIENGNWMLCSYFILQDVDENSIELREGLGLEIWKPIDAIKQEDITAVPKLFIEKLLKTNKLQQKL